MWSVTCNPDNSIDPFNTILEKDSLSKGRFWDDFLGFCEIYQITRCPAVSVHSSPSDASQEIVRIVNSEVDLSTWRAVLLALSCIGSKVVELYIHNSKVSAQQLVELSTALNKINTLRALKLQFIDFNLQEDESLIADAFKSLLSDSCGLTLLSVVNCELTDTVGQAIAASLTSNFLITGLNLSYNLFTDETLKQVLMALRYTTNVKHLVMRNNNAIEGNVFIHLIPQLFPGEVSSSDDSIIKANVKIIADKNKAIKDQNKKRKKAGYVELAEVSPPDLIQKVGKTSVFCNATLETLDLACNPAIKASALVEVAKLLQGADPEALAKVSLKLKVPNVAMNVEERALITSFDRIISLCE
eukprot:gene1504-1638_t